MRSISAASPSVLAETEADGRKEKGAFTASYPNGRGFAGLSKAKLAAVSSLGGIAAHQQGTAHEFDTAEATAAGRLGGIASAKARRKRARAAEVSP